MLYVFATFVDCLPQQSEAGLGKIEYDTVTSGIEKASGAGNKRNFIENTPPSNAMKLINTLLRMVIALP